MGQSDPWLFLYMFFRLICKDTFKIFLIKSIVITIKIIPIKNYSNIFRHLRKNLILYNNMQCVLNQTSLRRKWADLVIQAHYCCAPSGSALGRLLELSCYGYPQFLVYSVMNFVLHVLWLFFCPLIHRAVD